MCNVTVCNFNQPTITENNSNMKNIYWGFGRHVKKWLKYGIQSILCITWPLGITAGIRVYYNIIYKTYVGLM